MERRRGRAVVWGAVAGLGWLLAALSGCDAAGGSAADRFEDRLEHIASEKARLTAPDVPAADRDQLSRDNAAFAFDLYGQLSAGDGNVFCSPVSVSIALAMTSAGARGETAAEIEAALHFTLPQDRLHPAFDALDLALSSRGGGATDAERPFQLRVVNALWPQTGYPFLPEFLDRVAEYYGAGLNGLDYGADPDGARLTINDWVAEQTEDRILDLLPDGSISTLTRLVLTNAIYFDAAWTHKFSKEVTRDAPFTLLDGTAVTATQMNQTEFFPYAEGDRWQAVRLPYDGGEVSMVVLLPAAGAFAAVEGQLGPALLDEVRGALAEREVHVALPRFSFEQGLSLKTALEALGMVAPFDQTRADFGGMADTGELYISDVIHKAFVAVDEDGTEAAAATAVIMAGRGAPVDVAEFVVDRPFVYWIQDDATGTLLFLGRTVDPR